MDRVPGYELGGREFESLRARQIKKAGPCDRLSNLRLLNEFPTILMTEFDKHQECFFLRDGAV
jgi:hypothetical protein